MADMNPLAKGEDTSAYREMRISQVVGAVVVVVGSVLGELNNLFPGSKYVGMALIAVGGLKAIAAQLGYINGRATITAAAISTDTLPMSKESKH